MDNGVVSHNVDSNARPYGIFFSYLTVCLGVTVFILFRLFERTRNLCTFAPSRLPRRIHVLTFATLAAGSLLSTWGFMFRYFQWSYDNWLSVQSQHGLDPSVKHWGLWLKETSLFKEAWESVIVGHTRYWWSHQIFFWACLLGVHLEWKGVRRGINYTWAFMLLGQIVAISFATNLFLLTLLSSPRKQPASVSLTTTRQRWLGPWLVDGLAVFVTSAAASTLAKDKYWYDQKSFMPLLLIPHAALLVLPSARAIIPARLFNMGDAMVVDKIYSLLWTTVISLGVQQLIQVTRTAYGFAGFQGIWDALLEHPAVSSVGFDNIFCYITWLCWWLLQAEHDSITHALSGPADVQEKTREW